MRCWLLTGFFFLTSVWDRKKSKEASERSDRQEKQIV